MDFVAACPVLVVEMLRKHQTTLFLVNIRTEQVYYANVKIN